MKVRYILPATILFCAVGCLLFLHGPVSAQVISHQQAKIDDAIVKNDSSFNVPTSIVVVPIFPPTADFHVRDSDWFRGVYYYMVANERRPGFTDIPFHYVVTADGRIFKGNAGGEERKISVDGLGSSMVVIGYLAGRSDNAFDPRAKQVLGELIIDIANRNTITPDHVSTATIRYTRDDTAQTVKLEKQDLFGLWGTSLKQVMDNVRSRYAPIPKTYAMTITGVTLPDQQVTPGATAVGSITIKNNGEFGSYFDSTSELIASRRDSGSSKFFLQDVWLSTSQFGFMQASDSLLPGEEKKFDFKMYVPLFFGQQIESYDLYTSAGQKIADTGFDLKLNVAHPSQQVVEVKATETGWLRVRSSPSGAAEEIAKVSQGERYYVTGDAGNGWIKIKLTNGSEGWVSLQYLTYL